MRFPSIKSTAIAFLGLGQIFLNAKGSPTGLTQTREITSDLLPYQVPRGFVPRAGAAGGAGKGAGKGSGSASGTKPRSGNTYPPIDVPDAFGDTHKYTMEETEAKNQEPEFGTNYDIKTPHYTTKDVLDQIGIDEKDNSINILKAYNADDTSPKGQKLFLDRIAMSLFTTVTKKSPEEVSIYRFDAVIEPGTRKVMDQVLKANNRNPRDPKWEPYTVEATATGDKEVAEFNDLLATKFGKMVDISNQEFSTGKTIDKFTLKPASIAGETMEVILTKSV